MPPAAARYEGSLVPNAACRGQRGHPIEDRCAAPPGAGSASDLAGRNRGAGCGRTSRTAQDSTTPPRSDFGATNAAADSSSSAPNDNIQIPLRDRGGPVRGVTTFHRLFADFPGANAPTSRRTGLSAEFCYTFRGEWNQGVARNRGNSRGKQTPRQMPKPQIAHGDTENTRRPSSVGRAAVS